MAPFCSSQATITSTGWSVSSLNWTVLIFQARGSRAPPLRGSCMQMVSPLACAAYLGFFSRLDICEAPPPPPKVPEVSGCPTAYEDISYFLFSAPILNGRRFGHPTRAKDGAGSHLLVSLGTGPGPLPQRAAEPNCAPSSRSSSRHFELHLPSVMSWCCCSVC